MLQFIEKHSIGLIATLGFHIILLGVFNLWYITPPEKAGTEELIDIILEAEELERLLQEQELKYEKVSADQVTTGVKNLSVKERLAQAEKIRLDRSTEKWTDEQIEKELKELEQSEFDRLAEGKEPIPEFVPSEKENKKGKNDTGSSEEEATIAGPATVTCDLPGRTEVGRVYIPAYLCKGQGKVVVNITVDRMGVVEQAKIDPDKTTSSIHCHLNFAKEAASSTNFDRDLTADPHQKGTITYIFLAQ